MKTLVVIGGGASGMMAAATTKACSPPLRVVVAERLPRTGKKLLATGNGRCNYTNISLSPENYHGSAAPELVSSVLGRFGHADTIELFRSMGVVPRVEERGKVFPYSGNASAVADALRFECSRLGVETLCGFEVRGVKRERKRFLLLAADGRTLAADAVVLAAGGKASPALGSDGSGFEIARSLGHSITPLAPALVQLRTEGNECRALAGIKVRAEVSAVSRGEVVARDRGELLFVDYGLSGPPVFQLSTRFAFGECDSAAVDICPEMDEQALRELLESRRETLGHLTCEEFFVGFVNKRVGNLIMRRCGVEKLSLPVPKLSSAQLGRMAHEMKNLTFKITGSGGWQNAQTTAGGVDSREVFADSMMSRRCAGLFLCGEIFDLYGDCGGYNLQWAWSSGVAAGRGAAEYLMGGVRKYEN